MCLVGFGEYHPPGLDVYQVSVKLDVQESFSFAQKSTENIIDYPLKGTGTQDLIGLKVVSLDRSWLVGLTDDI